jgi:hypothetical protein
VNPRLQEIMKELGDAINSSVSESESIARVIATLQDEGYDIFLALQATIGFNRRDNDNKEEDEQPDTSSTEPVAALQSSSLPEFAVNANDIRFLKALRINVEEAR